MTEETDKLRELLARLKLGQRKAAKLLEVDEREFRRMCAGTRSIPRTVMLALEHLVNQGGVQ